MECCFDAIMCVAVIILNEFHLYDRCSHGVVYMLDTCILYGVELCCDDHVCGQSNLLSPSLCR